MSAYNKTKWCLPLDALSAKNIFVSADSFQKLLMNYSKRKSLMKNVGLTFFVSNYIHQIKENMQTLQLSCSQCFKPLTTQVTAIVW